ncbi:MAG: response regulator, partial [Burkholderiales bacterium]|nr:response regulator [Burkholderiales bacterium]
MLRVLIVDDEPPARARLRQVLADCAERVALTVAGEADGGLKALTAVEQLRPDVVLLDIHMPGMDGLEVARHLSARATETEPPPAVV